MRKKVKKKLKKIAKKTFVKPRPSKLIDLAHSPGHKKINRLDSFTDPSGVKVHIQESAINNMANSDKIRRINSKHRRIITGDAIGKTGRIVIK